MTIVANRASSALVATGTASIVQARQLMGPVVMGPLGLSVGTTLIMILTSSATETRLGAPLYWSWLLTGLQVLALWAAGAEHRWGWLLGASVQPPWIVYAVLTDQVGFIPGCAISAAIQISTFLRERADSRAVGLLLAGRDEARFVGRSGSTHSAGDAAGGEE